MLHPVSLGIPGVLNLVHDGQRVAAVGVHTVIKAHRGAYRVQGLADLLPGQLQGPGDFVQSWFPVQGGGEGLLALQHPVGHIPDAPGYPNGAVVPEVTADFSGDHWNAVGGEFHLLIGVKIHDGLHETDAAHLKKVIRAFAPLVKALDYGQHQPQIALNQLIPGRPVPGSAPYQKVTGLLLAENLKLGCGDAADVYFTLHGSFPPMVKGDAMAGAYGQYFPGEEERYLQKFGGCHKFFGAKGGNSRFLSKRRGGIGTF